MKVYACIEGEEVSVDLTPGQIAAMGVDPWRLDLMDPDPVRVENLGQIINFTRLRDCAFAYVGGETLYVGIYDGERWLCLRGDYRDEGRQKALLSRFTLSDRPFEEHFAEYLKREESKSKDTVISSPWFDRLMLKSFSELALEQYLISSYPPGNSSSLTIKGDSLNFDPQLGLLSSRTFCGAMLELRTVHGLQLPDAINWVHTTFLSMRPTVIRRSLAEALLGRTPKVVDFTVDIPELGQVEHFIKRIPGAQFIRHLNVFYNAYMVIGSSDDAPGVEFSYGAQTYRAYLASEPPAHLFTIDAIASRVPNQISCSRISLRDISERKLRPFRWQPDSSAKPADGSSGPDQDQLWVPVVTQHLGCDADANKLSLGSYGPVGAHALEIFPEGRITGSV